MAQCDPPPDGWRATAELAPGAVTDPECPDFLPPSDSDSAGSGDAADGTLTAYRVDCVDGINRRYASTIALTDAGVSQSPWVYESDQGCCDGCPDSSSASSDDSSAEASSASSDGSDQSGGTVEVDCCPEPVPEILYATFGGTLAPLGTVTLGYVGGGTWNGTSGACGGSVIVTFYCELGLFDLGVGGLHMSAFAAASAAVCAPFSWADPGFAVTGAFCVGTASVVVTA